MVDQGFIKFRAEVFEEDGVYVAINPDLDVSSFGATLEEAKDSLREAVEAFLKGRQSLGSLEEVLQESGFRQDGETWIAREPVAEDVLVARA